MAFSVPPVLEIDNVSISYRVRAEEVPAVINASLLIRSGEALGLVGESGCGKTTLASAIPGHIAGTGRIVGGTIRFRGRDIARLSRQELRRIRGGGIGMVHQDAMSALNPSLTVGEQLAEAVVYHRNTSWTTARSEAASMLSDVRLPDPGRVMEAYPHQLSGGQQQRAVIAMALLARPTLLLLDEPTTALDVTVEAGIIDLIGSLRSKYEMALLYISHNLGVVAQVCGRVAVMYSGEIVEQGPAEAVFASPRHPYTLGLLRCIPQPHLERSLQRLEAIRGQVMVPQKGFPGCLFGQRCRDFRAGVCDHGRIAMEAVETAPSHQVRCRRWNDIVLSPAIGAGSPPAATGTERTAVDVKGLDKEYPVEEPSPWRALTGTARGAVRANQQLSFRARQGQILAIVGESGCGKTTFAKILTGLETATGGEIRFADLDISRLPVERRPRDLLRALQMVFQNPDETLNPSFTVGAQIARAVKKLGAEHTQAGVARRTRELLELTHLPAAFASRRPRQLSGGQKQRVGIARAFAGQPQAVVADEPVSALDVSVRAAITELLLDILRRQGTTLIVISHDLGLVRYLADRVVVMYLGQVMEAGSTEQLFNPPYHPYTEALLAAAPIADLRIRKRKIVLSGEVPNPADPPKGCPFHTRCPRKLGAVCEEQKPAEQRSPDGHRIACHIPVVELARVEPIFAPASPVTEQ